MAHVAASAIRPFVAVLLRHYRLDGSVLEEPAWALQDSGASESAITEIMTNKLNLPVTKINTKVSAFGSVTMGVRKWTSITIASLDGSIEFDISKVLIENRLVSDREKPPTNDDIKNIPHYKYLKAVKENV